MRAHVDVFAHLDPDSAVLDMSAGNVVTVTTKVGKLVARDTLTRTATASESTGIGRPYVGTR